MYKPKKTVFYKLRFSESWIDLPLARNISKQDTIKLEIIPQLLTQRNKIKNTTQNMSLIKN